MGVRTLRCDGGWRASAGGNGGKGTGGVMCVYKRLIVGRAIWRRKRIDKETLNLEKGGRSKKEGTEKGKKKRGMNAHYCWGLKKTRSRNVHFDSLVDSVRDH